MPAAARSRIFRLERMKEAAPATGEAQPSDAKQPAVYKFRANDGDFDRYQDRLNVNGWQLDAFNANPVLLYNHDAGDGGWLGLGRKDVLPIGKARVYVEGDALMAEVEFDQDDEFARKVESKVAKGMLNAVSVRYLMHKYHDNERGGVDCDEQELLELSIVTIPGNQRATRVKGALSADEQDLVDAFAKALAGHLSKDTGGERIAPEHPLQEEPSMTPEQIKAMQEENARLKAAADAAAAAKALEEKKAADDAQAAKIAEMAAAKIIEQAKGQRDGLVVVMDGRRAAPTEGVQVGREVAKGSGIQLVRAVKALAVAKMSGKTVDTVLKGWGYTDVAKALSQGSFTDGGSLVHPEFASDFIELLRNKAVIRQAGARVVPMGASLTFDGQTGAASASYGGETTVISGSQPKTGQPLVLSEKKLTGLVPIPNDLIRNASIAAEEFVRDDLLQVMALTEDLKFLYGSGTQFEPKGLSKQLKAANVYAMTALGTANTPTIGELKKEINKAKRTLKKANAPMRACVWLMSPTVEAGILNAVGPGGEGSNAYEREMTERGTLAGFPYFVTNQIPESSSADLFLFDMSEVLIGESMGLELEVFPNGAFTSGGQVISGISTDQTVLRAISKHDIGMRHDVSGINVTGVTWGF